MGPSDILTRSGFITRLMQTFKRGPLTLMDGFGVCASGDLNCRKEGWKEGRKEGRKYRKKDKWKQEWKEGWMEGQMEGRKDK